jgi:hypothetical protein
MNSRVAHALRILIGSVLGTIVGIIILKYGDYYEPAVMPSHLYQTGTSVWVAGLGWWAGAGLAIGFIAGLITLRLNDARTFMTNALSAAGAFVIMVAILSYQRFDLAPDQLTLVNYLIVYGTNLIYFMYLGTFPALFGILIAQLIIGPFNVKKRSALSIMPDELRERFEHDEAARKQQPILQRIFDHTKKSA